MPTLRRSGRDASLAASPGRPEILLSSESPYGSRRLGGEYDGSTTAAYVYGESAGIAAFRSSTPQPAPRAADRARGASAPAPVIPAGHTKPPEGLPQLDRRVLRALWLEEGD